MNGLTKVIIVIAVSCMVTACKSPIGAISGGEKGSSPLDGDSLIASPKRTAYDITDWFIRDNDLNVFIAFKGVLHTIPLKDVNISVIENPSTPDVVNYVSQDPDTPYMFKGKGKKKILVEYNELVDEYYVEVTNPYDIGGGNGSGDGPGIEVIWVTR